MDLNTIDHLARLVSEFDLSEIEIKRFGERIRVVGRQPATVRESARENPLGNPDGAAAETSLLEQESPTEPSEQTTVRKTARPPSRLAIKAPMVGTFYRAPAPEAPPFAEVGQMLEVGQTVCIIEAMKLMNEIHSDVRGKIVSILVENAQPVEFGQVLLEVDPAAIG